MITRFHGLDRHKEYSTVTTVNCEGAETGFLPRCDFRKYIASLTAEDAVVLEASGGAFHAADCIENTGATVMIIDPRQFKIISESYHKTDKRDSRVMAQFLRRAIIDKDMFSLPVVYRPKREINQLRQMFSVYTTIQQQIVTAKNHLQGMLKDSGIVLNQKAKLILFAQKSGFLMLDKLQIPETTRHMAKLLLQQVFFILEQKEDIAEKIVIAGAPFEKEVRLLITINGISPFMALAFLSDVGDIHRFKNSRSLNAYLGLVPSIYSSGGKTYHGHATRCSRWLTRTLFTQSVMHFAKSSPKIEIWIDEVRKRRGVGRGRLAMIRRMVGIMRRMLLDQKPFLYANQASVRRKSAAFENALKE